MRACQADPTPAGVREAAIFVVLYVGGARHSELAGLDIGDWTPEPPALRVCHRKSHKERLVPLMGSAAALEDWWALRCDRSGGLFLAISRYGKIVSTGMTRHAIYNVPSKREAGAGGQSSAGTTSVRPSPATSSTPG